MAKKSKIKIKDVIEYENCFCLKIVLDMYGDGTKIIEENLNMGYEALENDEKGIPHYKKIVKQWAQERKKIHDKKDTLKTNIPNKNDEIELDDEE